MLSDVSKGAMSGRSWRLDEARFCWASMTFRMFTDFRTEVRPANRLVDPVQRTAPDSSLKRARYNLR